MSEKKRPNRSKKNQSDADLITVRVPLKKESEYSTESSSSKQNSDNDLIKRKNNRAPALVIRAKITSGKDDRKSKDRNTAAQDKSATTEASGGFPETKHVEHYLDNCDYDLDDTGKMEAKPPIGSAEFCRYKYIMGRIQQLDDQRIEILTTNSHCTCFEFGKVMETAEVSHHVITKMKERLSVQLSLLESAVHMSEEGKTSVDNDGCSDSNQRRKLFKRRRTEFNSLADSIDVELDRYEFNLSLMAKKAREDTGFNDCKTLKDHVLAMEKRLHEHIAQVMERCHAKSANNDAIERRQSSDDTFKSSMGGSGPPNGVGCRVSHGSISKGRKPNTRESSTDQADHADTESVQSNAHRKSKKAKQKGKEPSKEGKEPSKEGKEPSKELKMTNIKSDLLGCNSEMSKTANELMAMSLYLTTNIIYPAYLHWAEYTNPPKVDEYRTHLPVQLKNAHAIVTALLSHPLDTTDEFTRTFLDSMCLPLPFADKDKTDTDEQKKTKTEPATKKQEKAAPKSKTDQKPAENARVPSHSRDNSSHSIPEPVRKAPTKNTQPKEQEICKENFAAATQTIEDLAKACFNQDMPMNTTGQYDQAITSGLQLYNLLKSTKAPGWEQYGKQFLSGYGETDDSDLTDVEKAARAMIGLSLYVTTNVVYPSYMDWMKEYQPDLYHSLENKDRAILEDHPTPGNPSDNKAEKGNRSKELTSFRSQNSFRNTLDELCNYTGSNKLEAALSKVIFELERGNLDDDQLGQLMGIADELLVHIDHLRDNPKKDVKKEKKPKAISLEPSTNFLANAAPCQKPKYCGFEKTEQKPRAGFSVESEDKFLESFVKETVQKVTTNLMQNEHLVKDMMQKTSVAKKESLPILVEYITNLAVNSAIKNYFLGINTPCPGLNDQPTVVSSNIPDEKLAVTVVKPTQDLGHDTNHLKLAPPSRSQGTSRQFSYLSDTDHSTFASASVSMDLSGYRPNSSLLTPNISDIALSSGSSYLNVIRPKSATISATVSDWTTDQASGHSAQVYLDPVNLHHLLQNQNLKVTVKKRKHSDSDQSKISQSCSERLYHDDQHKENKTDKCTQGTKYEMVHQCTHMERPATSNQHTCTEPYSFQDKCVSTSSECIEVAETKQSQSAVHEVKSECQPINNQKTEDIPILEFMDSQGPAIIPQQKKESKQLASATLEMPEKTVVLGLSASTSEDGFNICKYFDVNKILDQVHNKLQQELEHRKEVGCTEAELKNMLRRIVYATMTSVLDGLPDDLPCEKQMSLSSMAQATFGDFLETFKDNLDAPPRQAVCPAEFDFSDMLVQTTLLGCLNRLNVAEMPLPDKVTMACAIIRSHNVVKPAICLFKETYHEQDGTSGVLVQQFIKSILTTVLEELQNDHLDSTDRYRLAKASHQTSIGQRKLKADQERKHQVYLSHKLLVVEVIREILHKLNMCSPDNETESLERVETVEIPVLVEVISLHEKPPAGFELVEDFDKELDAFMHEVIQKATLEDKDTRHVQELEQRNKNVMRGLLHLLIQNATKKIEQDLSDNLAIFLDRRQVEQHLDEQGQHSDEAQQAANAEITLDFKKTFQPLKKETITGVAQYLKKSMKNTVLEMKGSIENFLNERVSDSIDDLMDELIVSLVNKTALNIEHDANCPELPSRFIEILSRLHPLTPTPSLSLTDKDEGVLLSFQVSSYLRTLLHDVLDEIRKFPGYYCGLNSGSIMKLSEIKQDMPSDFRKEKRLDPRRENRFGSSNNNAGQSKKRKPSKTPKKRQVGVFANQNYSAKSSPEGKTICGASDIENDASTSTNSNAPQEHAKEVQVPEATLTTCACSIHPSIDNECVHLEQDLGESLPILSVKKDLDLGSFEPYDIVRRNSFQSLVHPELTNIQRFTNGCQTQDEMVQKIKNISIAYHLQSRGNVKTDDKVPSVEQEDVSEDSSDEEVLRISELDHKGYIPTTAGNIDGNYEDLESTQNEIDSDETAASLQKSTRNETDSDETAASLQKSSNVTVSAHPVKVKSTVTNNNKKKVMLSNGHNNSYGTMDSKTIIRGNSSFNKTACKVAVRRAGSKTNVAKVDSPTVMPKSNKNQSMAMVATTSANSTKSIHQPGLQKKVNTMKKLVPERPSVKPGTSYVTKMGRTNPIDALKRSVHTVRCSPDPSINITRKTLHQPISRARIEKKRSITEAGGINTNKCIGYETPKPDLVKEPNKNANNTAKPKMTKVSHSLKLTSFIKERRKSSIGRITRALYRKPTTVMINFLKRSFESATMTTTKRQGRVRSKKHIQGDDGDDKRPKERLAYSKMFTN